MALWKRVVNVFRGGRLSRDFREEMESHMAEAIEQGRDPDDVRQAFGSALRHGEESHDARVIQWLDSLRADAVFGWRQLMKRKTTSAAAVLSLALAIGACESAFRLIDAMLLRPLPVADPGSLYVAYRQGIGFTGTRQTFDGWAYPAFQLMRDAVKDDAELMAISYSVTRDLTYQSDEEMEKARVQYVSGSMFSSFGLSASLGRLLTADDDRTPGAHPYAVLSYDYWTRRFGRDPRVIGRTYRTDSRVYEIVGVGPREFTGTETGSFTDIFVTTMMYPAVLRNDQTWTRIFVRVKPGTALEPLRQKLHATCYAFERDRAKGFTGMTKKSIESFINQTVKLESAGAGASGIQQDYRRSLTALGVLVGLVLLIACANVANLMSAQAAARAREMALRVSIGAGRWRLIRLVLVEGAWLGLAATVIGGAFAWWSAPFVVSRIGVPGQPARLVLPADWRIISFGVALTFGVTLLFSLAPALRASAARPASALKGGEDPHSRRRLMHLLVAAQVAFCFLVVFAGGLLAVTFDRMTTRPMGFSSDRLLVLNTVAAHPQSPIVWEQAAEHLRALPGVERVAIAGWALLGNNSMNSFVSVGGAPPGPVLAYFLAVSPGWIDEMKLPLIGGRDFRANDTSPGAAIVNQTFAKQYFHGENPVGRMFARGRSNYQIVGLVGDAPYRSLREPVLPAAYIPFRATNERGEFLSIGNSAFIIRTSSGNPLAMAAGLQREVSRARPELRVSSSTTEADLVRAQTLRERLLAMLGVFFAGVALLLASIGLYGVLAYSVVQRQREIGIRRAIGAPSGNIARIVSTEVFAMVLTGAIAGLGLGRVSAPYIDTLLYQVKATDPAMIVIPGLTILGASLLAALPAVIHAVRIDPMEMLRSE